MASVGEANRLFMEGDASSAAAMYHALAREGDTDAAFNFAYCLWRGIGVDPDFARAKNFFAFARDTEGGDAAYNLALMYMHGEGVPVSYKKSLSYMRFAAEEGCVEAQLYLGMVYTTGFYLEPDIVGIRRIPFHTPEYRTYERLLYGDVTDTEREEDARSFVVEADAREAFLWFQAAARHDPTYTADLVAKGKFLYAKCFVDGFGTEYDRQKGARLMLLAGRSGSADAVAYLSSLGVTPAMLENTKKSKY